jgi:hypothetical protein
MILRRHTRRWRLPVELTERIIDHLHDCPVSLRACALVCWDWLDSSRLHLFYAISLHPTRPEMISHLFRLRKLRSIIDRCPRIAFHVRELHVFIGHHNTGWEFSGPTWDDMEKLLPSLLQSFVRLHTLEVFDVIWPALAPTTGNSLLDLIAIPSLIHLRITCAFPNDFGHLITLLPRSLKQLTLSSYGCDSLPMENEGALVGRQPCRLEHLTLGSRNPPLFADWLLSPQSIIDLSNLRILEAECVVDRRQNGLMRLVRGLGRSLEHITLHHSQPGIWGAPFSNFPIFFFLLNPSFQTLPACTCRSTFC